MKRKTKLHTEVTKVTKEVLREAFTVAMKCLPERSL